VLANTHASALVGVQVAIKSGEVYVIQLIDVIDRKVRQVAQEGISNLQGFRMQWRSEI
jgi:hypothetical protein